MPYNGLRDSLLRRVGRANHIPGSLKCRKDSEIVLRHLHDNAVFTALSRDTLSPTLTLRALASSIDRTCVAQLQPTASHVYRESVDHPSQHPTPRRGREELSLEGRGHDGFDLGPGKTVE